MKKILILTMIFSFAFANLLAKEVPLPPANKPDIELTCDEADARINDYQSKIDALNKNLVAAKAALLEAENNLATQNKNLQDCEKEILALIEATEAEVDAFRQKLGVIEGKVRQMKGLSNDVLADRRAEVEQLENDLNELRKDKIAVIPEFYDKILSLAKDIKGLYREKEITGYTVGTWAQDRDCLWNIAGKMEIYGDPFQWPKIWQANTDIIRNPDIIHPGQVLQVPPAGPKTDDETKAERRYYRNKRAAAEEVTPVSGQ